MFAHIRECPIIAGNRSFPYIGVQRRTRPKSDGLLYRLLYKTAGRRDEIALMSTPDDANTWHELAEQGLLLPGHIEVLRVIESALQQQDGLTDEQRRLEMLKRAREFARFATSSLVFPEVAFPPEAGRVTPWDYDEPTDTWRRRYEGREDNAGPASVQISGTQLADGTVIERKLAVRINDLLTANEGRQLSSVLVAAADELDRLNAS